MAGHHHSTSATGKTGWQERFLQALADIPNVTYAAEKARITVQTAYRHRNKNPVFAAQWQQAAMDGVEKLEKAAWQRARDGVARGVWMRDAKGRIRKVETVYDYPESLTMFLLRAHKPDTYKEKLQTEITGAGGAPIVLAAAPVVIVWPHETGIAGIGSEVISGNGGNGKHESGIHQIQDAEEIEDNTPGATGASSSADQGDSAAAAPGAGGGPEQPR